MRSVTCKRIDGAGAVVTRGPLSDGLPAPTAVPITTPTSMAAGPASSSSGAAGPSGSQTGDG
ncbi:unnamed protein product, partial [Amoebophrya sp. A120]|eukprot:GSA120T00018482001.1